MTLNEAIDLIDAAKVFADINGRHRELVMIVHPDRNPNNERARLATAKLSMLYAESNKSAAAPAFTPIPLGDWVIDGKIAAGDIAEVFRATKNDGTQSVIKIARSAKDNDLMEQEYSNLGVIKRFIDHPSFDPLLSGSRIHVGGRQANIMGTAKGHTLEALLKARPVIEDRHRIWMVNRALTLLGAIHKIGVVHGAILPEHLVFNTETHGLTIVDWCYSVTAESKKHVPAMVKSKVDNYPPEVARKQPPMPSTDLFMLMATMARLAPIPKRFKSLYDWCLAASPQSRPRDAWTVQDQWKALAVEEYGPPKFVEFQLPEGIK